VIIANSIIESSVVLDFLNKHPAIIEVKSSVILKGTQRSIKKTILTQLAKRGNTYG